MINLTFTGTISSAELSNTWPTWSGACKVNNDGTTTVEWDETILSAPTEAELATSLITYENALPTRQMTKLRLERDSLLASSDWTQSPDSPLTAEAKAEWAVHRQSLRDLPANSPDPSNPTWPDTPE